VTAPQKGSAKGPEPEKKGKAPESTAPSKAGAPQKKENSPEGAAALAPASTATSVVEHARVLDKICKVEIQSATRVVVCYAAIAVPAERMAALTRAADKVAVWVEGKE
jgi:hypothetical protein